MQYDYAPGSPVDCALSRQIRAHIITRQPVNAGWVKWAAQRTSALERCRARYGRGPVVRRKSGDIQLPAGWVVVRS